MAFYFALHVPERTDSRRPASATGSRSQMVRRIGQPVYTVRIGNNYIIRNVRTQSSEKMKQGQSCCVNPADDCIRYITNQQHCFVYREGMITTTAFINWS